MRRVWAGSGQALESAAIVVVGLLLCVVVVLAVWGIEQGFDGDPLVRWRIAVDAWLIGHGVDLTFVPGTDAVLTVGLEAAAAPFTVSIGAWGIGLVTLWLHWRSGRRIARLPAAEALIAMAAGTLAAGIVGLVAALTARIAAVSPDLVQAFAHPALVALVGMLGAVVAARGHGWLVTAARALTVDEVWLRPLRAALRAGLGGAVGVLGVGALVVAVGIALRFTDALLLFESLQVTHLGATVLLIVQLAFAPVAVVWGAAWAVGPGFAFGIGTNVSPLSTDLGPVPSLPLLAAIQPNAQPWMLAVVVLPVLAGVLVGVLARQSVLAGTAERPTRPWELAVAALGGGVLAGMLLGVASMLSAGAVGPGRLVEAGPDALLVAAWSALEVGVGLLVGMAAGREAGGRTTEPSAGGSTAVATTHPKVGQATSAEEVDAAVAAPDGEDRVDA